MIATVIASLADLYVLLMVIYVLMSWLPYSDGILGDIYHVLGTLCEPYLGLFRRIIPPVGGAGMRIDFSPIVAILVLQLVVRLLIRFL